MSESNNPFIAMKDSEEMPSFPFLAMGDSLSINDARVVAGQLKELAFVGSDVAVDAALGKFEALPRTIHELDAQLPNLSLPTFPEGVIEPRDFVLGVAAVYGWEDPQN